MKEVIVSVKKSKYKFLIELLNNFDFVEIQDENKAKKELLKEIAEGMYSADLASKGKLPTRCAKSFLHEL